MSDMLIVDLSDLYGVSVADVEKAMELANDRSAVVDSDEDQPLKGDGYDGAILFSECEGLLNEKGWEGHLISAYATPKDVRVQLTLSRVVIMAQGSVGQRCSVRIMWRVSIFAR